VDVRSRREYAATSYIDLVNVAGARNRPHLTDAESDLSAVYDAEIKACDAILGANGGNTISRDAVANYIPTEDDKAFTRYLRTGDVHGLTERVSAGFTTAPTESGQTDSGNAGYAVPQGFWQNMQVALKAYGGIANDFKLVETDNGRPMPWPTINPTAVVAGIIGSEITQLTVANPYVFGQGMLNAWTYATNPVLASIQLIQDSAFEVDFWVAEVLGEAIGRALAANTVSGTGTGQPLGVITALNTQGAVSGASGGYVGLTAATTVKTFAGTPTELVSNTLSPQTLINMVQGVDPAYYPTAKWYMNSNQAWNLHSVVDSNGRPLLNFANGFSDGRNSQSDQGAAIAELFGFPVVVDNNLPNLVASTTGGPVFGAMDHAMVYRQVNDVSVMRLQERYADYLAVGYIGYYRMDARSNDMRAAVTVKPAAT